MSDKKGRPDGDGSSHAGAADSNIGKKRKWDAADWDAEQWELIDDREQGQGGPTDSFRKPSPRQRAESIDLEATPGWMKRSRMMRQRTGSFNAVGWSRTPAKKVEVQEGEGKSFKLGDVPKFPVDVYALPDQRPQQANSSGAKSAPLVSTAGAGFDDDTTTNLGSRAARLQGFLNAPAETIVLNENDIRESEILELGSDDLVALGEQDLIEDVESLELIEPHQLTGLHVEEELGVGVDLTALLKVAQDLMSQAKLARYSGRLVSEILENLGEPSAAGLPSPVLAEYLHQIAHVLRGGVEHKAWPSLDRFDSEALLLQPSYLPAHHALVASALAQREPTLIVKYWEGLAAQMEYVLRRQGTEMSALSTLFVELSLLYEFKLNRPAAFVQSVQDRASRYAGRFLLASLNGLRRAFKMGDAFASEQMFVSLLREAGESLNQALGLELVAFTWQEQRNPKRAVELAQAYLSGPGMPYALQLLAWECDDLVFEEEICLAQITRLVAEGRQQGVDEQRQDELTRRAAGGFFRLYELNRKMGEQAKAYSALIDAYNLRPKDRFYLTFLLDEARASGDERLEEKILRTFSRVAGHAPLRARVAYGLAEVIARQGGSTPIVAGQLLEALSLQPDMLAALSDLSDLAAKGDDLGLQREAFERVRAWSQSIGMIGWDGLSFATHRGEIFEFMAGDVESAFDAYFSSLNGREGDLPLVRSIERTGLDLRRFPQLVEVYTRSAHHITDGLNSYLWWRAAQVYEHELGSFEDAILSLRKYIDLEPQNQLAKEQLAHLYRRVGYWTEARKLLEDLIQSSDPERREGHLEWLVFVRAEDVCLNQIDFEPQDELLKPDNRRRVLLVRESYLRRRDWRSLETLCIDLTERSQHQAQRAALLLEAALVARAHLNDNHRAMAYLERILKDLGFWRPALDLLEEVLLEEGEWARLIEILEWRSSSSDLDSGAAYLRRAAAIAEGQLRDFSEAQRLWQASLEQEYNLLAWESAFELAHYSRDWKSIQQLVVQALPIFRDDELVYLLKVSFEALREDPERQAKSTALISKLGELPSDIEFLYMLAEFIGRNGKWGARVHSQLAYLLEDEADAAFHAEQALELWLECGQAVDEELLKRLLEKLEVPRAFLFRVLQRELDEESLGTLLGLYLQQPRPEAADDMVFEYARVAEQLISHGFFKQGLLLSEHVLEARSSYLPARVARVRAFQALEEWGQAADECISLAHFVSKPELQLRLLHEALGYLEMTEASEKVVALLETILEKAPGDELCRARLKEYYQSSGKVEALSKLVVGAGGKGDIPTRVKKLEELLALGVKQLGDQPYRDVLQELLSLCPKNHKFYRLLAEHEERKGEWQRAAKIWEQYLAIVDDPAIPEELLLRVAGLWLKAGQLDRALAHYDTFLRLEPHNFEAILGRGQALDMLGETAQVCRFLKNSLELDLLPWQQSRISVFLSEIVSKRGDQEQAIAWLAFAMERDPSNEEALRRLTEMGLGLDEGEAIGAEELGDALLHVQANIDRDPINVKSLEQFERLLLRHQAADPRLRPLKHILELLTGSGMGFAANLSRPKASLNEGLYLSQLLAPALQGPLYHLFVRVVDETVLKEQSSEETPEHPDQEELHLLCKALGVIEPNLVHCEDERLYCTSRLLEVGRDSFLPQSRFSLISRIESLRHQKWFVLSRGAVHLFSLLAGVIAALFPDMDLGENRRWLKDGGEGLAIDDFISGLPRRRRRELRSLAKLAVKDPWDVDSWQAGVAHTCLRSGLLFGQGVSNEVWHQLSERAQEDLIRFLCSDTYCELYRRVW